jgi:hypothetical protein
MEIDRLIEKMTERGGASTVLVNYHRRYDPNFRKMEELYREETLGACRLIQITYSRGLELNGSHILDMLFSIVGESAGYEIQWVSSAGGAENPSFGLALESGIQVVVSGSRCRTTALTSRSPVKGGGFDPPRGMTPWWRNGLSTNCSRFLPAEEKRTGLFHCFLPGQRHGGCSG